jgi:threonine/homoserine/homoserine lactone efflux protein
MNEFLIIAAAHFLAVASPSPDFVLVFNQALKSRSLGLWSSFGVALGILVHLTYSLIGIAFIIAQSIVLFTTIKYIGAFYLIYLGYKSLKSGWGGKLYAINAQESKIENPLGSIKKGFLVNVLNPKASLFFLALFTQIISPATTENIKVLYGIEMFVVTFLWFACISYVITLPAIKKSFEKIISKLNVITGAILICIGLKVLTEK